jgi:hypothetical protein
MNDDDGACCTRMVLFTAAWSRTYSPPSAADNATVVVCERADGTETDPVVVPTLALVAELITELAPPLVTIKSAAGEDVEELQRLVELATAPRTVH